MSSLGANKLQYFHGMYDCLPNYTAVVEVPSLAQVQNLIKDYAEGKRETVSIAAGITRVNPKDQYCKATGRTESLTRCKSRPFVLNSIRFEPNRTVVILHCLEQEILTIKLEISPNWEKPHLTYVQSKF